MWARLPGGETIPTTQKGIPMSKLLAALIASFFAVGAFAQEAKPAAAPTKAEAKKAEEAKPAASAAKAKKEEKK